jgi:hypothetical protein
MANVAPPKHSWSPTYPRRSSHVPEPPAETEHCGGGIYPTSEPKRNCVVQIERDVKDKRSLCISLQGEIMPLQSIALSVNSLPNPRFYACLPIITNSLLQALSCLPSQVPAYTAMPARLDRKNEKSTPGHATMLLFDCSSDHSLPVRLSAPDQTKATPCLHIEK